MKLFSISREHASTPIVRFRLRVVESEIKKLCTNATVAEQARARKVEALDLITVQSVDQR